MEYLGIDRLAGAIYEGEVYSAYRVLPPPSLAPIRFVKDGELSPIAPWADGLAPTVFREDDFDPVTKIRRGRVFKMRSCSQPSQWSVYDPNRPGLQTGLSGSKFSQKAELNTYERDTLPELSGLTFHKLPVVVIGWEPHVTYWKIVSLECNLVGTPVLTLKAHHSFGDLPEIIPEKVPVEIRQSLTDSMETVESSLNRLAPVDVIDRCRAALSIAFGHASGDRSLDLAKAIELWLKTNPGSVLTGGCGQIVARLHSRGKPNVQHEKGLRPPTDADAQLALYSLRFVLVELGWAH